MHYLPLIPNPIGLLILGTVGILHDKSKVVYTLLILCLAVKLETGNLKFEIGKNTKM